MSVTARGLAGLMIGLFFGASLSAHAQKVHAWIANEAVKFYAEQYGKHELLKLKFLGNNVEKPSYDEDSWIGTSFMEGAWEEDTTGIWFRHFVAGGESDELSRGLPTHPEDIVVNIPSQIRTYWVDTPYLVGNFRYASAYVAADDVYGRAVSAYSQDKELAYYFLGRVAHLLTDITVPAHTHNDRHWPLVDFYESTTSEYEVYKVYTLEAGRSKPLGTTPQYNTLQNLFGTTADYTEEYRSWGWIGGPTIWARVLGEPGDDEPEIPNDYGGFLDVALLQARHRPWVVNDLTGGQLDSSAYYVMADDLIPFAVEQTAALIRLFYKQVDSANPAPTGWRWSWISNMSEDAGSPTSVPPGDVVVRINASHPSGVKKNAYTFTVERKQGSSWTSVGSERVGQSDTITINSPAAGVYRVTATAFNGVGRTESKDAYFSNMDVSAPSNSWQAATNLGLIEGERSWSSAYLDRGDVHYYRFRISATATEADFVFVVIPGGGAGSNNLDIALGKVNDSGAFITARGEWRDVSTTYPGPNEKQQEELWLNGRGPGEYYVVVYGHSGLDITEATQRTNVNFAGTESGEYILLIHGPVTDAYEPDNTSDHASPIQTDGTAQHHSRSGSDVDWVKFQLNQESEVTIATDVVLGDYTTNNLNLQIHLFGPDSPSSSIASNSNNNGDARISRQGDNSLAPGVYYVRIDSYLANDIRDYTVVVTATPRVLPNHPPAAPDGITPPNESTGISLTPTLESWAFSDWDIDDTHQSSQWQVSTIIDFTSLVWDSGETTTDRTSIAIPAGYLDYTITYYWRVRHQDSSSISNSWSNWSTPATFTTISSGVQLSLTVIPSSREVGPSSGSTSFSVSNAGNGTMPWTAEVTAGATWLLITSGSNGTDSGTVTVSYSANSETSSRTGTVHIVASGAEGSPKDVTVTQAGAGNQRTLTISSSSGGSVSNPGEGSLLYGDQVVSIEATPVANYHFVSWTGSAVDAGRVANANSASTTVTVDGDYTLQANFAIDQHNLTTSSTLGGSVATPGEGAYAYNYGTSASVVASEASGYHFVNWTGTAVNAGKVTNPNSASTTVTVDTGYALRANFGRQDGDAPTISNLSPASGSIQAPLNSLIILHVTDAGIGVDADSVEITLDGSTIYSGDTSSYDSATGTCRRVGTSADYTYAYQSDQPFDFDQLKTVTVNASDIGGVVMDEQPYSFTTEMRSFGENKQVSLGLDNLGNSGAATVCDSSGNIWAVWHAGPVGNRDIYVGKLIAGADAFSASVRLTSNSSDQLNPAIALGPDDRLYVVWQDNRRGDWDIYGATSANGTTWSAEQRIDDSEDNQSHNQVSPTIVVDSNSPNNNAYVVWQDDRAGNQDIYVAKSSNSFATNAVTQITSNTSDQTNSAIAATASDTVHILWTDARNPSTGADIYGASSGTWTNVPVVRKAGNQSHPVIATESSGSVVHMLWVDQISGNSDIYYASSSGLPGSPVAGSNLVDDALDTGQLSPTLAVTGTGNSLKVFACWEDERNISGSTGDLDLYMVQTNSGSGTNVFVGDGGTNSDQTAPAIGVDYYGQPYVVWADNRGANTGIYYSGSTCMESTALVSGLIGASSGGTVGTVDVQSITDVDDVSIAVPAGACPYDVTISITRVENPHEYDLPILNGYEFSPSGLEFTTPVTIIIPYAVTEADGTPTVYWRDIRTEALSQEGISNIEIIELTPSLHALRFTTTHLTQYYAVLGATPIDNGGGDDDGGSEGGSSGGGGGGGGGGCVLSPNHQGSAIEYLLPYILLFGVWIVIKRKDART